MANLYGHLELFDVIGGVVVIYVYFIFHIVLNRLINICTTYEELCIELCIPKGIRKKKHFSIFSVSFLAYFVYNKKYDARPDNRKGNETQNLDMRKSTQSRSYSSRCT
jgi:hypothetical protein